MKDTDSQKSKPFDHPKNIRHGKARLIFVEDEPAGWVLPNGIKTTDIYVAHACAVQMDHIMDGRS